MEKQGLAQQTVHRASTIRQKVCNAKTFSRKRNSFLKTGSLPHHPPGTDCRLQQAVI
jgi:hypothetical protein